MPDLVYRKVIEKLTNEQWDETFDFSGIIPESTNVVSYTVTATKEDGTDVSDSMVISDSVATTIVTVTLNSLTAAASYTVRVNAVATDTTPAVMIKLLNVSKAGVYH
jgi:methionine-rich copper-binding protein CopC